MLSFYFWVYTISPRAILVQDWSWLLFIILNLLLTTYSDYFIKCFGHHTFLLISQFRGHLLYSKMPPMNWKLRWNTKISFSMENLAQKWSTLPDNVKHTFSMLLASVQPTLIPETLKLARSFEKWLMIGSIPDILDGKFKESTIRITPSYPLPYHLSPISTSHFMEEGGEKSWDSRIKLCRRIEHQS